MALAVCCAARPLALASGVQQRGRPARQRSAASSRASAVCLRRNVRARAEGEGEPQPGLDLENPESEAARKRAEAERLRAAERFLVVGTGEAECKACGYTYLPAKGDPEYPVSKGTKFEDLPEDWQCPVCGAEKSGFQRRQREVAGFAENQGYGLGTNSMTGEQKSLLIFGALGAFFLLFILGYTLN